MNFQLKKTPSRHRAVTILMAGSYVNQAVIIIQGFLLMPLYLHFIGVRIYGLWLATGGILAWLGFMDMGLGGLLIQRVSSAYGQRNFKRAMEYFVNGLVVFVCLVLLFCISIFALSYLIPDLLGAAGPEVPLLRICFQLAGFAAAIELLNNCLRSFSQALQRPLFTIVCMIVFRILGLAAIILLLFHNYKLWAVPIGLLINAIPVFFLNIYYSVLLTRKLGGAWKLNKTIIREFYQLGPVMLAGRMGNSLVTNVEPTIIAIISSPELAPAFVITKRAADMIVILVQVINGAIFPSFAHLYAEGDIEKSRRVLLRILLLCFGTSLIGFCTYLATNREFVHLWVGSEQFLGNEVTLLLALGSLMIVMNLFLSRFIIGVGDFIFPSLMILTEAVIRVCLMVIFLFLIDMPGLPLGMLISCIIFGLIYYKRLDKKFPLLFKLSWGWLRSSLLFIGIFSTGYVVALNAPVLKTWLSFGVYVCLVVSVLLFVSLLLIPALRSSVSLIPTRFLFKQKES